MTAASDQALPTSPVFSFSIIARRASRLHNSSIKRLWKRLPRPFYVKHELDPFNWLICESDFVQIERRRKKKVYLLGLQWGSIGDCERFII